MDGHQFDHLTRALTLSGGRRGLLGLLATLPLLGGLFALLDLDETDAKGRRKRRKKAHKHGKGRDAGKHKKPKCKPQSKTKTCSDKCGPVKNNCQKTVDCGSCDCPAPCDECFTCQSEPGAPGACIPQDAGTPCGAATCEGGSATPRGACDGSGACEPGSPVSCAPYTQCDGAACAQTCASNDDCVADAFCNREGRCAGDQDDGQPCAHGGDCLSTFCVDGVCCDTACDGACQVCNLQGSNGACTSEENGSTCGGENVCCAGDCQECCNSSNCSGNAPICDDGACVACSAEHLCPDGQCCAGDGSCVADCPSCQMCDDGLCAPDDSTQGQECAGSGATASICCDGVCCDGCCDGDGSCGACLAFITDTPRFTGNLGGLDGADDICQDRADANDLPGIYTAWLSIGTGENESPATGRFRQSGQPYQRVDGVTIASNWADLISGSLDALLDVTESGVTLGIPPASIWTNTNSNGTVGGFFGDNDCEAWINNTMASGSFGQSDSATQWTDAGFGLCSNTRRLYCFQQR